jgi:hypothetical protein
MGNMTDWGALELAKALKEIADAIREAAKGKE